MLRFISAVLVLGLVQQGLHAAGEDDPQPVNVSHESAELPLALYQSLRKSVTAIADNAAATMKADAQASGDEQVAQQRLAMEATQKSLDDLRTLVVSNQAQILRAMGSSQALHREMAARVLAFTEDHKAAVAALIPALSDQDPDVCAASAVSLGVIGDASATEPLLKAIDDTSSDVRARACEALGLIKDDQAVPRLMAVLKDEQQPQVRIQAAIALGRIKTGVKTDELSARLDQEPDDRVKMAITSALKAVSGSTTSLDEAPDTNDFQKRLKDVAGEMKGLHEKLREDRHDEVVQVDGQEVERKLQELIDELQRMEKISTVKQQDQNDNRRPDRTMTAAARRQGKNSTPSQSSGGADVSTPEGRTAPGEIVQRQERWAALPPKARDELLQAYTPEMPVQWRKRLEAYFYSLAVEEARETKSTHPTPPQPKAEQ